MSKKAEAIVLPVKINNNDFHFALHSAATWTIADPLLVPHLERFLYSKNSEQGEIRFYTSPVIQVGDIDYHSTGPVAVFDLTQVRQTTKRNIRGFLGAEFFSRKTVRFDFDNERITFYADRVADRLKGQRIPLYLTRSERALLAVDIAKNREYFLFDTAVDGTGTLTPRLFDSLLSKNRLKELEPELVVTVNGREKVRRGVLDRFRLGPFLHENLVFTRNVKNTLGLRYWSRYTMTVCFKESAMFLSKGKRYATPEKYNTHEQCIVKLPRIGG